MTQAETVGLPQSAWVKYTPAQRARIGAAYLAHHKRNRVKDALSNTVPVSDAAISELLECWRKLIVGFSWPHLWTRDECEAALKMPYQLAAAPFGAAYFMMTAERRRNLETRGAAFFRDNLPGVNPNNVLMGAL